MADILFPFIIALVDCGPLPPPLNGQIFIGNTTTGNVATYLCDSGFFVVDGDDSRVCGADGFWSGDQPICEGTYDYHHSFEVFSESECISTVHLE